MAIDVENYGLHWDGPIAWLVQGRAGSNFVGLKANCPYRVRYGACNHLIPTAAPVPDRVHWDKWMQIASDPLVQAMLPVPHPAGQNLFFLEDPGDDLSLYLVNLSRLSSPINSVVRPCWSVKAAELDQMKASNVQPLVLVQALPKHQPLLDAAARLALYSPRTVIVTGAAEMIISKPFQRITTRIQDVPLDDITMLPMENIGAALIRRYARHEPLDAPMESRDERRARMIKERDA